MWDIGPDKILIILVVALLVVGPKKIPEISRSLGKALRGFRDAVSGARDGFDARKDSEDNSSEASGSRDRQGSVAQP